MVAGSRVYRCAGHAAGVNRVLREVLAANGGVLRREDVLDRVDHAVLERAVRSGRLIRRYPCVYVDPQLVEDADGRIGAAVVYARGRAAVSHLSALAVWRLAAPRVATVHLVTDDSHHLRGAAGTVVHRRQGLRLAAPDVVIRNGWPITRLERTLVDCWPMLDGDARCAPVIQAVGQRMTTPQRVRTELEAARRLGGRRLLVRLLDLLAAGCRSNLEIWGYEQVFCGLGSLRWQVPVRLGARTVYLDAYDTAARVNFELDGAKYHASAADRERDLRRDAALATLGITVVRFSHERLVHEPDEVAREAGMIIGARMQGGRVA